MKNQQKMKMNNAVIYARYSSSSQTEQSIEGQLRTCREYAERKGYIVLNEYIDRAKSGTNDQRPAFQEMIADANSMQFQYIIVYMVDRFSRNKYDSTVYKYKLNKMGVKVLSAMEQISDSEEGYLVEGLLEMFAEQYSRKLSIRVKNGIKESMLKGSFIGGNILLGYKVIDKKIYIDEEKAQIIRRLFNQYANGMPLKKIIEDINGNGYRNNQGKEFNLRSFQNALSNSKYIGKYYFNGKLYKDIYPAIIDEVTFFKAQKVLEQHKRAPGSKKQDYLLFSKIFCGYCGSNMVGISGTGKSGSKHYYYACAGRKKQRNCNKKHDLKNTLEAWITENVSIFINCQSNINELAKLILEELKKSINIGALREFDRQIKAIDKELEKCLDLMLKAETDTIIKLIDDKAKSLELQKKDIEREKAKRKFALTLPQNENELVKLLKSYIGGNANEPSYRYRIIDKFINCAYVWDDKILIYFNIFNDKKISFEMLPDLEEAERLLEKNAPGSVNKNGVRILRTLAES